MNKARIGMNGKQIICNRYIRLYSTDLALIERQKNKFDDTFSVSVSDSFDGFEIEIDGEALLNVDIFIIIVLVLFFDEFYHKNIFAQLIYLFFSLNYSNHVHTIHSLNCIFTVCR
jgi:hypothetical protein